MSQLKIEIKTVDMEESMQTFAKTVTIFPHQSTTTTTTTTIFPILDNNLNIRRPEN